MVDDPNRQARERGKLDQFQDTFGRLADRFEPRADTRLTEQGLPRAEHPQDASERERHVEAAQEPPARDFLPNEESRSDFNRAAEGADRTQSQDGVASRQVGDDRAEPRPTPPPDHQDQDRATHAERMAKDDIAARSSLDDRYRERLRERAMQDGGQENQSWRQRDSGQDYDQSR